MNINKYFDRGADSNNLFIVLKLEMSLKLHGALSHVYGPSILIILTFILTSS
jgi:hypothetical protein